MQFLKMKTHFFFDMDGTICESRQVISLKMQEALFTLKLKHNTVVVISGAERERILKQLNRLDVTYIMAQSGADTPFWRRFLSERDRVEIRRHINQIKKTYPHLLGPADDLLQDRGSQITFSFTGHNANIEDKKKFDPDGQMRTSILHARKFFSNNLEVRVAGTTCFDYTLKNYTKGRNILKLIDRMEWKKEDCIYFGDAFFKGGNDETVKGIIDTEEVKGPQDLLEKLKKYA